MSSEPKSMTNRLLRVLADSERRQKQLHRTVNYDLYALIDDEKAVEFIDKDSTREVFKLLTGRIASTNKLSPKACKSMNRRIRALILKMKIFQPEDFAEGSIELEGVELYANLVNYGAIDGYRGELATTQRQKVHYQGLPGFESEPKKKRWGIF